MEGRFPIQGERNLRREGNANRPGPAARRGAVEAENRKIECPFVPWVHTNRNRLDRSAAGPTSAGLTYRNRFQTAIARRGVEADLVRQPDILIPRTQLPRRAVGRISDLDFGPSQLPAAIFPLPNAINRDSQPHLKCARSDLGRICDQGVFRR
jgi:hypothetical protein